ncbi:MAG: hypothetical protein A2V52_06420 [Actinobacteria bacterium RBG_19FT_COMBO_54_7]|nr:MAG: hypothetical protein A2V52_06420 [Actinobacteria bacterium RBG_19FT_COMBO_54_7]
MGVVYNGDGSQGLPYFSVFFGEEIEADELAFTAGVCSEPGTPVQKEATSYAIRLLMEFFTRIGPELILSQYRSMLQRIFRHIHLNLIKKWPDLGGLELSVLATNSSTGYAARSGHGNIYLFHDEMAKPLFPQAEGPDVPLLGTPAWQDSEIVETPLQAGDMAILLNPSAAQVMGIRDLTMILHRAPEATKASLFLSAIAERKGARGPLSAILWEVPNYQGAGILTEEGLGEAQAVELGDEGKTEHADQAKKHWLNLWRRGK